MNKPINFNTRNLNIFWDFLVKRQTIWHNRFVDKSPPPWTEDPILQRNKFTNVYRELDPGTRFAMDYILGTHHTRQDKVFNIMIYRLMCSIPTYTALGFQRLDHFSESKMDDVLCDVYNSGRPVFGNAYLISPYSSMGSTYKFRNVSKLFGMLHRNFDHFFVDLDNAWNFQRAFNVVNSQYGFGPFLAYQVMVDLTYPISTVYGKSAIMPFSQDEWAKLGPGAIRGFRRLAKSWDSLHGLRWLHENQMEEFDRLGIHFPFLLDENADRVLISLANMQNCLCEFHKYMSIREGTGKSQRIFVPTTES